MIIQISSIKLVQKPDIFLCKISELLDIAKRSALEAGSFLKDNFNNSHSKIFDDGRDIKLSIDSESEDLILNTIRSESNLPILSEESGKTDDLKGKYWIVDPLDGTSNYFRKIPLCAVSIALMENDKPLLGVIYDFMNDDLYYRSKKLRIFCNEQKISVSNITNAKDGTIMTGIPAKSHYSDEEFSMIINLFQSWKKVRMIGSAAVANFLLQMEEQIVMKKMELLFGMLCWSNNSGRGRRFCKFSEIKNDFRVDAKFTNGKVFK